MTCYLTFLPQPSIRPSVIRADGLVNEHGIFRTYDLVRFDELEDMPSSSLDSGSAAKRRRVDLDSAQALPSTPQPSLPLHSRRPLAAYNTWSTGFQLSRDPVAALDDDDIDQSFQEHVTYGRALEDVPDRTDANFRTTQDSGTSTQMSGWLPTQKSAISSKRPRTRASGRPSMGLSFSQSDSDLGSIMFPTQTQAGEGSISALPGFPYVDPARLHPLAELNNVRPIVGEATVTIMAAVLEVGDTRYVRPPSAFRGHAGEIERILAVCDVTIIQPVSTITMAAKNVTTMTVTIWGELVEDFVGSTTGVRKGDVVLFEGEPLTATS